jgi:hypothetical protein
MKIHLTKKQALLLYTALSLQISTEKEHLNNNLDSISKHKCRSIIKRLETIRDKIDFNE